MFGVKPLNTSDEALPLAESFVACTENFCLEVEGLWMLVGEEPPSCFFVELWSSSKSLFVSKDFVVVGLLVDKVVLVVVSSSSYKRPIKSWQQP